MILFCLYFFVPMIFAWGEFAANVCRGPEVAIMVSGSVIDMCGSASPEARSLCCLYDLGFNFAAFVDYYCGDFGFLVGLVAQGIKTNDISPGQLVAEGTQFQVDVKNGISLASPFQ